MAEKTLTARLALKDELTGKMTKPIDSVNKLKDAVGKVRDATGRFQKSTQETTGALGKMTQATGKTTEATGRLGREIAPIGQKIKAAYDKAKDSIGGLNDKMKSTGNGIGSVVTKVMGLVAAIGLVATATAGIKATIGGAMNLESQQIAMEHFIGLKDPGGAKAKSDDFIKFLRQNANVTPFETGEVISAGRRAVNIAGGDVPQATELVKLSEDMAALNPGKTLSDAIEALADFKVGETERMKEFGFKFTQDQMKKVGGGSVEKGAMILMNGDIRKQFAGGANKLSGSGTGLLSTITGSLQSGFSDAGIMALEKMKPLLKDFADFTSGDGLNKFVEKLSDGLVWLVEKAIAFGKWLKSVQPDIEAFATKVWDVVRKVNGFADKLGGWLNILVGVGAAILIFKAILLGAQLYLYAMGIAADFAAGGIWAVLSPVLLVAAAVAAAAALIYFAWTNNWGGIRDKTAAFIEWIRPYFKAAVDWIMKVWNGFVAYWQEIWPIIKEAFATVWSIIGPIVEFWVKYIWTVVKIAFTLIWDTIKWVFTLIWDIISTVWSFVAGIFKAFMQFLSGDFSGAWDTLGKTIGELFVNIWKTIKDFVSGAINTGRDFIQGIIDGFLRIWDNLKKMATDIWDSILGIFGKKQTIPVEIDDKTKNPIKPYWSPPSAADPNNNAFSYTQQKYLGGSGNSHASGLDYVPYDGYKATLHKGEKIQTPEEVQAAKDQKGVMITGNHFIVREEADIEKIARALARMINETGGLIPDAG